jgi:DNA polymerase III epsilon subunit-like protein
MVKLFIDTETTGLPVTKNFKYYNPKNTKYYDNARIIEIAYIIYDDNDLKIKEVTTLIKPSGFVIENSHIHGITTEDAIMNGLEISDVLEELYDDLFEYSINCIIAHNINFDINVILSECHRLDKDYLYCSIIKINKECTMHLGKIYLKSTKNPKLNILYEYLFNKEVTQEHRALSDTKICAACYFKMAETL